MIKTMETNFWELFEAVSNLELFLDLEDLKYINSTKKDFDRNSIKAIEKYQNKIHKQSFKNNLF